MNGRPLRVHIVSRRIDPAHGPGGLERHVRDQALHLAAAGVAVTVWTERPGNTRVGRAEALFEDRVAIRWIPPAPLPLGYRAGTIVLDRISNYPIWAHRVGAAITDPHDIVHVHGLAGLGAARRVRAWKVPLVMTTHGMEEFVVGGLKGLLYAPFRNGMRRIAHAADRVVVTDEALRGLVGETLSLSPERLTLIPNAIDPDDGPARADLDATASLLRRLDAAGAAPLFVSVGRLEANKGYVGLVQAFAEAGLAGRWRWVLVGEGSQREAIQRAIDDAGLGDQCFLPGHVDDAIKHGLLATADWFVHPTLYEGSSLVTLEAMAHALPVLGTRAGGLPDKIEEGRSGLLVAPGSVGELAAALRAVGSLDAGAFGTRAREIVRERFSWEAMTPRFLAMYSQLLAPGPADA